MRRRQTGDHYSASRGLVDDTLTVDCVGLGSLSIGQAIYELDVWSESPECDRSMSWTMKLKQLGRRKVQEPSRHCYDLKMAATYGLDAGLAKVFERNHCLRVQLFRCLWGC